MESAEYICSIIINEKSSNIWPDILKSLPKVLYGDHTIVVEPVTIHLYMYMLGILFLYMYVILSAFTALSAMDIVAAWS